ncbi:MAG: hypothetical protein RM347_027935 [Nostoc sp. ChiQUE02]|uniref:hypothetical protein n=1 Tax=Nostoc sp. ChiQUE02 TaxID=3075377 RepID=UPI002AD55596|nr:hypothetical protein [Nostoc sp. ChiQUE02]MDZ8234502.1 hypothetical protein [Nostoc sp. ChiQUE02]
MCDFTELQTIRNNFRDDLTQWFDIAHTLVALASLGSDTVFENLDINPVYSFRVPIKTSLGLSLASINDLKYSKMGEIYLNHKLAIPELIFERLIQLWYKFLNQIVEQLVKESLAGSQNYPEIEKLIIKSKGKEEIIKLICKEFEFDIKNIKKTKKIENYLGQKIDAAHHQNITVAIILRNLLEHNKGIIRENDLNSLNSNSIKLINDSCQEQNFLLGEKVKITIYEVYKLKNLPYHISKQLIPD